MKRVVGIGAGLALLVASVGGAASAEAKVDSGVTWGSCVEQPSIAARVLGSIGFIAPPEVEPEQPGVECATLRVPLDYRDPYGQKIKLALNRVKGSVSRDANHLGTLLVNPGGPGASGLALAKHVAAALPPNLAGRFDVVGFDPRGVGKSEPALRCVDPVKYFAPPRPDQVPRSSAAEQVLLGRAEEYAARCGNLWSWMLPHLTTENSARDMDAIRAGLGEERISYFGYSYGTYLGAVYASLFPHRLKRLVLDSAVDPKGVWYKANLAQNLAFERRHRDFLAWAAKHNAVYQLGRTAGETSFAYYSMRQRLATRPAGGVVGPSELDDLFTLAGYANVLWPRLAGAWSSYVRQGQVQGLVDAWRQYAQNTAEDENGYAVYLGVQCADAKWPRSWATWRTDMARMHRVAPFLTWPNAWYNAPCAFWATPGGEPVPIKADRALPPILIIQTRRDAATPYEGAVNMRRHFPSARMLVVSGGGHGVALAGNKCVDQQLFRYLEDGTLPRRGTGCAGLPEPTPAARMAAGSALDHLRLTQVLGRR
ncbi:alpha/beta hydrolase [Nonomuraea africana]|uniref:Pimeloyl-ACP methyl ester carboxylesterase n=1 Tax=Nonomuraea africana TaxID=46171 RepID=A0ABR9K5F4_9ACTN|nr:alpha/beta hydrolase [Nonomuraea africana]MBE1557251.1 pimeloyl-ACP methyl ester carboxylesterase [Nonomuraea africana]